ncbi:MAG TPA: PTS sugar transporter subunit IIC [Atopostipes sp.]|nr:PTS sugar transporter subunit IIC [Atopostipes sp.]
MDTVTNFLEEKMQPIMYTLNNNRYLKAIQAGFFGAMPVMVIGSIFLLFSNFPVPGYPELMASIFGENWAVFFTTPFRVSMNILSIFIFLGVVKSLADYYKVDSLGAQVLALVGFLILTPTIANDEGVLGISMTHLGSGGLFLAILTAVIAVEIYRWVIQRGWTIEMPDSVPAAVSRSFTSLIPGVFIFITFTVIHLLFSFTQFETAYNFIYQILQAPLNNIGGSLWGVSLAIFAEHFLWAFGIHGSSVVSAAVGPVFLSLTAENAEAFAAGATPPNIVTQQFLAIFVNIGGSGSTIGLVLLCLLFARSRQMKLLGQLSIGPGIFMINEPIIFGIPMVLNPVMMIPLILVPLIMGVVTYFVMAIGLVPLTNGANIPWTTPPIIGGFLLSGWQGAVYQVFQIFLSMALYYPFFRIEDNKATEVEAQEADDVEHHAQEAT